MSDGIDLLRLSNAEGGDIIHIGVVPDKDTGKPVAMAEVPMGSASMWMAISDGVATLVEDAEGHKVILAPIDWIRANHSDEATSGLYLMEQALREEGMLP